MRRIMVLALAVGMLAAGCKSQKRRKAGAKKPGTAAGRRARPADAQPRIGVTDEGAAQRPESRADSAKPGDAGTARPAGGAERPTHVTVRDGRLTLGSVALTLPQGWTKRPVRGKRQLAVFDLPRKQGESTAVGHVMVLGMLASQDGGYQDWMRRWAGQFRDGAPAAVLKKATIERFDAGGARFIVLDYTGTFGGQPAQRARNVAPQPDHRVISAIVATPRGAYHVRASGPAAALAGHADAIRTMFRSARPAGE